jgi:hypothetical protein
MENTIEFIVAANKGIAKTEAAIVAPENDGLVAKPEAPNAL